LGGNGGSLIGRAVEVLEKQGHHVIKAPTTGPRTAGEIVRRHMQEGADLIVAAGGDGTINEVAEGMVHTEVPLAILPAGTANVLAVEMRMGRNLLRAADRLRECRPHRISVGRVSFEDGSGTRHFLLMAGVGLDAQIVYNVSLPVKARVGKLAYWLAGWGMLGRRLAQFEVESNNVRRPCSFALVSKVRNYGGDFEIARSVNLFDDRFELVLFEGESSLSYLKYLAGLVFNRVEGMPGVSVTRTRQATLEAAENPNVYVQIDGEFAGRLPAKINIVPDAITLMVPPQYDSLLASREA
jgi:diacylglycerol kinase (ATP)